jgi:hypothetical protein
MAGERVVFVRCELSQGGFPSERAFVIRFKGGEEYRGIVPVRFCYTQDGKPLGDAPTPGKHVKGLVMGVKLAQQENDTSRVQLPDGNIYELDSEHIVPLHAGDESHVPV